MEERDRQIIAQNAGSTAAALLETFLGRHDGLTPDDLEEYLATYDVIRAHVYNGTIELVGVQIIQDHIPGAQVAPAAPVLDQTNVVPLHGQMNPPPVPPPAPPVPPPAPPAAPPQAATGAVVSCPFCGSGVYDNRAENARRLAQGQKKRPAFKCKNSGCTYVDWGN